MTDPTTRDAMLDAEIDRTVREMMNVEPATGLRRRVLDRLERPRAHVVSWPRLAAATAVAAALLVAFWVFRAPEHRPEPIASTAEKTVAPAITEPHLPRQTPPPARIAVDATRSETSRTSAQTRRLSAAVAPYESTVQIAPLDEISPIAVAPVQPSAIAPQEIVIAPLTPIAEVEVGPLLPSGGRE
jgi:hypothetical protein